MASDSEQICQVYSDENPNSYKLSVKERELFRKKYPLEEEFFLPPKDPNDSRPTLVLDLDETLIHTTQTKLTGEKHTSFCLEYGNEIQKRKMFVNIRPNVRMLLDGISQYYETVVFTASLQCYADVILDKLDPQKNTFEHRLYRRHCSLFNGVFVKDLEKLGRSLKKIVFVDNFPGAYMMHPKSALPIKSFLGSTDDTECIRVRKMLEIIKDKNDVRPFLKKYQTKWTKEVWNTK